MWRGDRLAGWEGLLHEVGRQGQHGQRTLTGSLLRARPSARAFFPWTVDTVIRTGSGKRALSPFPCLGAETQMHLSHHIMEVTHVAHGRSRRKPSPASRQCRSPSPNTRAAGPRLAGGTPTPGPAAPTPALPSLSLSSSAPGKAFSQHPLSPTPHRAGQGLPPRLRGKAAGSKRRTRWEWAPPNPHVAR